MHGFYLEQQHHLPLVPVKRTSYAQILNIEFNTAFHQPRKDQCDTCDTYEKLPETEKLAMKVKHESNLFQKEQARAQKQSDKELAQVDSCV